MGFHLQHFRNSYVTLHCCKSPALLLAKAGEKASGIIQGGHTLSRTEVCTRAKRRSKEEAAAGQWAALLSLPEEQSLQEGITTEDLNKICNKGLKLMLSENTNGLLDFQDELNTIGSTFTESDHKQGALFIYVLWKMCDHTIVDQTVSLEGIYLEAFRRVFDILEDSGWSLVREKDKEEAADPSLDDLPNLPYMQQL